MSATHPAWLAATEFIDHEHPARPGFADMIRLYPKLVALAERPAGADFDHETTGQPTP